MMFLLGFWIGLVCGAAAYWANEHPVERTALIAKIKAAFKK